MIEAMGFELKQTCSACPEQYDVYRNGAQVAYLRLRHGYFYCAVPDVSGVRTYESEPEGDGIFDNDDERAKHLYGALVSISQHYGFPTEGELTDAD